jgi:putative addiction module component (TIGR02574 family)
MTTKTKDIISIIESLPIDIKNTLIEKLLNSLYPSQKGRDKLWAKEAERSISEIKTGKVKTIPGDQVFKEIHKKYHK